MNSTSLLRVLRFDLIPKSQLAVERAIINVSVDDQCALL